jgi:hypothetical protein
MRWIACWLQLEKIVGIYRKENHMLNAKEFQEQLEWFWLFCQEEAWSEE